MLVYFTKLSVLRRIRKRLPDGLVQRTVDSITISDLGRIPGDTEYPGTDPEFMSEYTGFTRSENQPDS